jgi:hypothetical protein
VGIDNVVRYIDGKAFEKRMRQLAYISVPHFPTNVRAAAWTKNEEDDDVTYNSRQTDNTYLLLSVSGISLHLSASRVIRDLRKLNHQAWNASVSFILGNSHSGTSFS